VIIMAGTTMEAAVTGATPTTTSRRFMTGLRLGFTVGAVVVLAVACQPVEPEGHAQTPEPGGSANGVSVSEPLSSIPPDLRERIDGLIETISDPWSGAKGLRAKRQLLRIGAPSVPWLLHRIRKLDFESEDDRCAMTILTETLWEICQDALDTPPDRWICRVGLQKSESAEIEGCCWFRKRWLAWFVSPAGQSFTARANAEMRAAASPAGQ